MNPLKRWEFWAVAALFFLILFLVTTRESHGWNYPKDGRWKVLSSQCDPWFYVDNENWDIKAPDKYVHFTGNQVGAKLLRDRLGAPLTIALLMSLNIYKEHHDAYREGWSNRDLLVDVLGLVVGLWRNDVIMTYNEDRILLRLCKSF